MNLKYKYNRVIYIGLVTGRIDDEELRKYMLTKFEQLEDICDLYLDYMSRNSQTLNFDVNAPHVLKLKQLLQGYCNDYPEHGYTPGHPFFLQFNLVMCDVMTGIYYSLRDKLEI